MSMIECVPNFSEGRDREVIGAIRNAIERVRGAHVLDVSADPWHHRSVITFAAPAEVIADAAFAAIREARDRIDLRTHRGEHPRMGAADVVPFIPLPGSTMEECIELSRLLAERVGRELEIPVFLYAESATRPERRDLAAVRRGGFEGLSDLIGTEPARDPDFGPRRIHPTAGATAIGARDFLVAFNVFLGSATALPTVRDIARTVRASNGGLPGVKALVFEVNGRAQLSMNVTDLDATPVHVVYETVVAEAAKCGLTVEGSELIGLAPERVFASAGTRHLGLPPEAASQQLEARLRAAVHAADGPGASYPLAALEEGDGIPSAGSAAALAGALAAALAASVAQRGDTLQSPILAERAAALQARLEELARLDAAAWDAVLSAEAMPAIGDRGQGPTRETVLTAALIGASGVALEIARACRDAAALAVDAAAGATGHVRADALTVALIAEAATRAGGALVRHDVSRLPDPGSARAMVEAAGEFERTALEAVAVASRGQATQH